MTEPTPFYLTRGFLASGVFLLLLMLVGVAMALSGGGADSRAVGAARARSAVSDSACGLPAGRQDPLVGPPAANWTLVGTMAAPTVEDVGPGVLDGKDRRCYAHSPVGAAVAAANMLALTTLPGDSLTEKQAVDHVLPGRVRDVYANQPGATVDPSARFQIAGVGTDVVDRDNVTVTLAVRSNLNTTAMASMAIAMRWWRGDWRGRLLSVERPFIVERIESLEGLVKWSGA